MGNAAADFGLRALTSAPPADTPARLAQLHAALTKVRGCTLLKGRRAGSSGSNVITWFVMSHGALPTRARRAQELLHHAGAGADYKRLSERLSPARLAAAWPAVCTRMRGEGRASGGSATFLAAEPALIACAAEALPEMGHISTLIIASAE